MSSRAVLHVGIMKSGTTYLQSRVFANKPTLRERGVLVPGRRPASHVQAALDLAHRDGAGMWAKLTAKVRAHDGTALLSSELLGAKRPAVIEQALADLPDDVQVVVTARDLNRSLAAMWQETLQNGRAWHWSDFLADVEAWRPGRRVTERQTPAGTAFWWEMNLARIVDNWARAVGRERVTVVTVPPPGAPRDLLWERFAQAVGIDHRGLPPGPSANESLGAASAQVLRRVNEALIADDLPFPLGMELRKGELSRSVMSAHKESEPAIGLPVLPWVVEQTRSTVGSLKDLGVRLVGDWSDLTPVDVPGIDPETVSEADVAAAATAALAGFLARRIREAQDSPERLEMARRRAARDAATGPAATTP